MSETNLSAMSDAAVKAAANGRLSEGEPIVTFRGWGGHFICAHRCSFRLNTLVEHGERRAVVSTVGGMQDRDEKKIETIGCDRYYETYVFPAHFDAPYWEADVSGGGPWTLDQQWSLPKPGMDEAANAMHYAMVAEVVRRFKAGEELD